MPSKQIKSEEELIESENAALPKELLLNSVLLFEEENEAEHIAANSDETPKQEIGEVEKNIEPQGQVLKLEDEDTETYYQKVKKEIVQYLNWRQEYVDNLRHKAQERLINSVKVTTKEHNRISTKNKKGFKKASTESSRTKRDKKIEKDGIKLNSRKNNTAAEPAKLRKGLFDVVKTDSKKRLNTDSTRLKRHDIVKNTLSADKSKKRLDTDTTFPKRHDIARSALSADKSKKRLDTDTAFSKKHNIAKSALSANKFKKSLVDGSKTDSKKNLDTGTKRSKKRCGPKSKLAIEMNYNVRRRSTKKRHIFQGYKGEGLISIKKTYENYKGTRQPKLFTMSPHKHQKMRATDIKYERKKADNRFSMKI
jgi:hypothetical protein